MRLLVVLVALSAFGCNNTRTYRQDAYPVEQRGWCWQAWSSEPYYEKSTMVTLCTKPNLYGGRRCHFHTPWWDNMESSR